MARQSDGGGFGGWLKDFWNSAMMNGKKRARTNHEFSIGDVWNSEDASIAFLNGRMNSIDKTTIAEDWAQSACLRVAFRNKSCHPLLLSWVDQKGGCHHFYTLKVRQTIG